MTQITMMVTHREPDILQHEVKWTFRSTAASKASGCDGIPAELFKILKGDAIKMFHSMCQKIWKSQQWPEDRKRSTLSQFPRRAVLKNVQATEQLQSSPVLVKLCSKSSRLGFRIMQT